MIYDYINVAQNNYSSSSLPNFDVNQNFENFSLTINLYDGAEILSNFVISKLKPNILGMPMHSGFTRSVENLVSNILSNIKSLGYLNYSNYNYGKIWEVDIINMSLNSYGYEYKYGKITDIQAIPEIFEGQNSNFLRESLVECMIDRSGNLIDQVKLLSGENLEKMVTIFDNSYFDQAVQNYKEEFITDIANIK